MTRTALTHTQILIVFAALIAAAGGVFIVLAALFKEKKLK